MVTTLKKELLCKENEMLLKFIYKLGKGVMFKSQIQSYMKSIKGIHEIDTSKSLHELKDSEVIDFIYFHRIVIVKLRKFAISFLEKKGVEEVTAVSVTNTKIKRSAFLNEIVLRNMPNSDEAIKDYVNYFNGSTTYFKKDKQYYKALLRLHRNGLCNENLIAQEINRLVEAEESVKARLINSKNDSVSKVKSTFFNLNSMVSSNIHLGKVDRKDNELMLNIDILDLNGTLSIKNLSTKICNTFDYLNSILDFNKFKLCFNVYVLNEERKKFIDDRMDKVNLYLMKNQIYSLFDINVINLNLENKLFNKQKIL